MTGSPLTNRLEAALRRYDGSDNQLHAIEDLLQDGASLSIRIGPTLRPLEYCLKQGAARVETDGITGYHNLLALLLRYGADFSDSYCRTLASAWKDGGRASRMIAREDFRRNNPDLAAKVAAIAAHLPLPPFSASEDLKTTFLFACQGGRIDDLRYILHFHPEAVTWTQNGGGPLARALSGDKPDACAFLIAAGADIDHANSAGMTALMIAARLPYGDRFIPLLIEGGANESLRNVEGDSAHDIAKADNPAFLPLLAECLHRRDGTRRKGLLARHGQPSRKFRL